MNASCTDTHKYHSHAGVIIKSPAYPDCYPVNKICHWDVSAPIGFEISIEPFEYGIEESIGSGCQYDYLNIVFKNIKYYSYYLCGRDTYTGTISAGRNVFIEFDSDSSSVAEGFQFRLFITGMKIF